MWKTVTNEIIFRSVKESFCTELRHRRFSYKSVYLVYIPARKALLRHDFLFWESSRVLGWSSTNFVFVQMVFIWDTIIEAFPVDIFSFRKVENCKLCLNSLMRSHHFHVVAKVPSGIFFMFSPNSVHCSIKSIRIVLISMYILV